MERCNIISYSCMVVLRRTYALPTLLALRLRKNQQRIVAERNHRAIGLASKWNVQCRHRPRWANIAEVAAINGAVAVEQKLPGPAGAQSDLLAGAENRVAQIRNDNDVVHSRRGYVVTVIYQHVI